MQRTLFALLVLSSFASSLASDVPRVLVTRFTEKGNNPQREWVGRNIQRALVTELSADKSADPMLARPELKLNYAAEDAGDIIQAGRAAGAAYVVVGAYEVADQELMVIGKTYHVDSGKSAGSIDARGGLKGMFKVQAEVARQVKDALWANAAEDAPREREVERLAGAEFDAGGRAGDVIPTRRLAGAARPLAVGRAVQARETQIRANDAGLTLEPRAVAPDADVQAEPTHRVDNVAAGNAITGGPGNTAGSISGNTVGGGGSGLTIVGTPGSVMTGGSGNIFLSSGGGNSISGGSGNYINGGDGNQIIGRDLHQITGGDAHVMQGGDGNFNSGGAGITIQPGPRNTAGGISGNTAGGGSGNTASGSGNTASGSGNTNR